MYLMKTGEKFCPRFQWHEQFFLLFWQLNHAAALLSEQEVQIPVGCPLISSLPSCSLPLDGKQKLHVHFLPPSFYSSKIRSRGTNAWYWLEYLR